MTEPAIELRRERTRRSVTRDNPFPIDRGGGYFQILVPSVQPQTGLLPAYLPLDFRQRDRILDSTVRADAMWSAAIGIAITKAASMSWEAKSDGETRSKKAQELLLSADATSISGIGGWVSYLGKQVRNFTCTNAGCFTEIIRANGAYGSKIVGLGHLSALRMRRTGDPEYPFIYIDRWGRQHVMRWWQVFNLVDMPDPDEAALGVGLCAAERAYQQIRKLAALEQYIYEKLSGSRPLALHIVNGLTKDQLTDMMNSASNSQASKGLSLYMGAIVATTLKPDSAPSLVTIPLAELPDGFEAEKERDRADLIYANSLGLDPQDLKPMSNQQMGAGAQSEVLNQKAEGRGQAAYRQQLTHMLNQLVFDNKTQFLFTEHDYRDQQAAANVSAARGAFITGLVQGQVISPQQGQQVLVEQGELPKIFIEQGAQAGSDLSDTDKPDVNDPLNDISGPPQPTAQAVMVQQPQAPGAEEQPQSSPGSVPPLVPKKTSTVAQPKAVLQQKSHDVRQRHIQAGARRILRRLNRGGSIHVKDDSGGVWRYIHGHPVLIKGGSGGGSSGGGTSGAKGKGKSKKTSGATATSGDVKGVVTDPNATPKPQKKNVPTHGAGGQSKYPTLDAYKKGQISHSDALAMLQADIKTAKLKGDQKAVNTLNTQYYGLKKSGPKPAASKLDDDPLNTVVGPSPTKSVKTPISELHNDPGVIEAAKLMSTNEWFAYNKKAEEIAAKHGISVNTAKSVIDKANQTHNPFMSGPQALGTGPTVASVAKEYGLQEAHLKGAQSLIEKHKAGQIADATYKTQMYKLTKEAGVSKAQLEKASSELGSTPKYPGAVAATPKPNKYSNPTPAPVLGNYATQPLPPLAKTTNTPKIPGLDAAKYEAMPPAKQDLIKLGSVYDQHGGTSTEYTAAIAAYNQKHGTSLTWSSAGPAVKTAKQEAGILPSTTKHGAGIGPTGSSSPKSPTKEHKGETYQMAHDGTDANSWGNKNYAQWRKGLTSGEEEAFIGYSKHGDGPINDFLRKGKVGDEDNPFYPQKPSTVNKRIAHLDAAIAKGTVPENVVTVRSFSHNGLVEMMKKGQDLSGAVFHDNAYVSTSVNNSMEWPGNIKMHIHVPKGSKGAYMDGSMKLTKFPGEYELLLGRDSNFRIIGYSPPKNSYGKWQVEVEYLGTGPMPAGSYKAEN